MDGAVGSQLTPRRSATTGAVRIALVYGVVAILWILLSDRVVAALGPDAWVAGVQSVKGIGFVVVTAGLLFALIRRSLRDRDRAATEANETHRRLVTLMDNLPGMVFRCRAEAARPMEVASPVCRSVTGHPPEAFLAGRVRYGDLIHVHDRERVREAIAEAARTRSPYVVSYRLLDAHGTQRWVREHGSVVCGPEGPTGAVEGFVNDITDTKSLEDQLVHAQKLEAMGRLATGVAHDFNNLLSVITGYGELLSLGLEGSRQRAYLDQIRAAADRAAALTRQLLAFSRREAATPRVVDLNEVVLGQEKLLRRIIGEDVTVSVRAAPAPVRVRADPGHLEQIVMNLAVNARDAMPEGGELTIEVGRQGENGAAAGVLVVRDSGVGMEESVRAQIFEPFFTTKASGEGTGLGLSIVSAVVERNGGRIDVESVPGEGTSFQLAFPLTDAPQDDGAPEIVAPAPARGDETVLVVEDEANVLELVQAVLEEAGYQVLTAQDGAEALERVEERARPIDLLITDLVMPQMDGRELARRLTARTPGVPTLYMTGYDSVPATDEADEGPIVLRKPFTPAQLRVRLREVLGAGSGGDGSAG